MSQDVSYYKMKIDVSVTYENGQLYLKSEAAGHSECRPSVMVLSRCPDGTEVIEAIGEPFDIAMQKAAWEQDKGSRTYRSFDPFAVDRFEPDGAGRLLFHLCQVAHRNVKPKRGMWRTFWRLDRFLLKVKIPHYTKVPSEKREIFEGYLRKRISKFEITDSSVRAAT